MSEINFVGPVPRYRQLQDILTVLIQAELEPGAQIPSERALSLHYGLARATVRQAVNELITEGRLIRVPGRGTFVATTQAQSTPRFPLISYHEDMGRRGLMPTSHTVSFGRTAAGPLIAAALGIDPGAPTIRLIRSRCADGIPMVLECAHLPEVRVPGLLDAGVPDSLYRRLRELYGLTLTDGGQSIQADGANWQESLMLDVAVGTAVLRLTRLCRARDVPIEYTMSTYRADRYRLAGPVVFRNTAAAISTCR